MSETAEPPFNDLWTVPGEEDRLDEFQAQDRRQATTVNPLTHYHHVQIEEFLQALLEGREPAVSGKDGRAVVEMFTAIYRSNQERRPVKIPLA
jgi:predicted dehydrogenase